MLSEHCRHRQTQNPSVRVLSRWPLQLPVLQIPATHMLPASSLLLFFNFSSKAQLVTEGDQGHVLTLSERGVYEEAGCGCCAPPCMPDAAGYIMEGRYPLVDSAGRAVPVAWLEALLLPRLRPEALLVSSWPCFSAW